MYPKQFPIHWAVLLSNDVKKWINEEFKSNSYNNEHNSLYFHFPNYRNNDNFYIGNHLDVKIKKDYTLITNEQFINNIVNKNKTMENKEIISYKLIKPEYEQFAYEIANDGLVVEFNKNELYNLSLARHTLSIPLLKEAGVLDIWFEPVYKKEEPKEQIVRMGGINGFDLTIKDNRILHNLSDITAYVKLINTIYSNTIKENIVGNYCFNIKDVILEKTGCEYKETMLSEWLAIYELIK